MEELPESRETMTVPVTIPVPDCWRDHHVSGRAVLPAVEALQILARTLPAGAGVEPLGQRRAAFPHLLAIAPESREIPALHEYTRCLDGSGLSRLLTVRVGRQSACTRRIEHACVRFLPLADEQEPSTTGPVSPPGEPAAEGEAAFTFSSRRLYEELVPFGEAYRNVTGEVRLTRAGAAAHVLGGNFPGAMGPLGSPFPFDAALHVACAWGQRYHGLVAFPVGFDSRQIHRPTAAGERYRCAVVPLPAEAPAVLRFAIGIYDEAGRPMETIQGVEMRDIAGGSRIPPAWIREGQ